MCLIMQDTNPIEALFERAKSNRVPMSHICKLAGVDPTTPSRWKNKRNGATVEAVNKLNAALSAILNDQQAA